MEDNDIQSLNSTQKVNSFVPNITYSVSTSTLSTNSKTSPVPTYSKSKSPQKHKYNKYNNYKDRKEDNKYNYNNNYNNRSRYNPSTDYSLPPPHHHHHKKRCQDPSFVPKEFQFSPEVPYKLIDFVGGVNYTPSQDNGKIFNRVVKFFRNITTTIEQGEKLLDFKFYLGENQIHDNSTVSKDGFYVNIIQSDPTRSPPSKRQNCISCDTESETNKISRLAYPSTTREEVSICHNLWLDAKARSMFIITPKRHVERLSDCNDHEIFSMFLLAVQVIEQETRLSNAYWNGIRFIGMILNHGNSRNLEHLHLKIRIKGSDFNQFRKFGWDDERKEKYKILKSGLYRRDERIARIS